MFSVDASPVHKATVVPRGSALGYVMQLPEKDELSWSKKQLLAKMDVCMGGRVAEEMIFGEDSITTGMVIISLTPLTLNMSFLNSTISTTSNLPLAKISFEI